MRQSLNNPPDTAAEMCACVHLSVSLLLSEYIYMEIHIQIIFWIFMLIYLQVTNNQTGFGMIWWWINNPITDWFVQWVFLLISQHLMVWLWIASQKISLAQNPSACILNIKSGCSAYYDHWRLAYEFLEHRHNLIDQINVAALVSSIRDFFQKHTQKKKS